MAFYQEELAIYLSSRLERRVDSFCMDKELHPRLKQNWCMKAPPSPALISEVRHAKRRPASLSIGADMPDEVTEALPARPLWPCSIRNAVLFLLVL